MKCGFINVRRAIANMDWVSFCFLRDRKNQTNNGTAKPTLLPLSRAMITGGEKKVRAENSRALDPVPRFFVAIQIDQQIETTMANM
jgi:hypothetical protein